MTLALRLRERGFGVTLFEASDRTGGLAKPTQIGKYSWDQFYHVILMSDINLLDLLMRLGLSDRLKWSKTKTGFLNDGHLYSMSNIMEFLTFPPLRILDKLRLGLTIFYTSKIKSPAKLEKILVEDWLRKLSGKRTFTKIWLPLLKSKLGENYKVASASFIWASIDRMYKARRTGLKTEMFGYVDGGYAAILDRFQKTLDDLGVKTICQSRVTRVADNNSHVNIGISTGESLKFDYVILTLPCLELPCLCPQLSDEEKKRLKRVILMAQKSLAGYYITNLTDGWVPFTAVIEMTAVVDKTFFDGNSLIYLPRYVSANNVFCKKGDREIQEEFVSALERIYPQFKRGDIVASKIVRGKNVLPITTLDYSKELLPPVQTSLKRVFIVNSAQIVNGTMNVNEIVGLANRKSKEIIEFMSNNIKEEIENAKDFIDLFTTSKIEFMAISKEGETPLIYGKNLPELVKKKIELMGKHINDEPYIDPNYMMRRAAMPVF